MTVDTPVAPPPFIARTADIGLLLVRVITGVIFIVHGAQKIFVTGLPAVVSYFGAVGVPLPQLLGPGVAMLELLGGTLLVVGLFARQAGLLLMGAMMIATVLVHLEAGFLLPKGYEFTLLLVGAASATAFAGPGRYSLDAFRARARSARRDTSFRR